MKSKLWWGVAGWGVALWFIGYVLGIVLFFVVPTHLLGWVISPIGVVITLWVLCTRVQSKRLHEYLVIGAVWMLLAIFLDYFFIVKLLKPADGYYKLDVYLYYVLTLLLPILFGWWKIYAKK